MKKREEKMFKKNGCLARKIRHTSYVTKFAPETMLNMPENPLKHTVTANILITNWSRLRNMLSRWIADVPPWNLSEKQPIAFFRWKKSIGLKITIMYFCPRINRVSSLRFYRAINAFSLWMKMQFTFIGSKKKYICF